MPSHPTQPAPAAAEFIAGVARDLRRLAASPPALWVIFAVKLLESIAYFIVLNLAAVYLRYDLHFSDREAGDWFGLWATSITLLTFCSGFVADALGIRRAMIISVVSCLAGRVLLALAHTRSLGLAGLFVMSWGVASMVPTMTGAVRRYTRSDTVAFAFSFFYVVMNIGAAIAPLSVGWVRQRITGTHTFTVPGVGPVAMSSSQVLFSVGAAATFLAFLLVVFAVQDAPQAHDGPGPAPDIAPPSPPRAHVLTVIREVVFESAFWRFMLFVTLLVLVKLVFQHAHQTWPTYTLREFGQTFPFGYYWTINPVMIIFLTPVVTAFTRHRSAFWVIVLGSIVTALSVLVMAFSTTVAASVVFIVLLSLGEALWSPRLYEYTAVIAPRGREASYMGLSSLPMFVAKLVVGSTSGRLLAAYCPATGPRHSQTLWLVIGLTTVVGPLLIIALRRVIEGPARPSESAVPVPAA